MDEQRYRRDIVRKMKVLGVYNKSFDHAIKVLAKILRDYDATTDKFNATGGNIVVSHTNKNGSTNLVKNPFYLAIEKQRDDIIAYSRELGLTPAGLKRINSEGPRPAVQSTLDKVLSDLAKGG